MIPPQLFSALRSASAESEADSDRDGFASWKAETHSLTYGFVLGFVTVAPAFELKALVAAAVVCNECRRYRLKREVLAEIRSEPQYFMPALVAGVIVSYFLHGRYVFGGLI